MGSILPSPGADPGVDRTLIQSLAREFHQTEHHVEIILREELERLSAQARINTFVGVLATSNVRHRLRDESVSLD